MIAIRRIPRFASTRGIAWAFSLALLLLSVGCKGKGNSNGPSSNLTGNDPLLAGPGRIPRQNVPVPGRDGTAGGKRADPLLGSPTSGTRANSDADRWKKGPYMPGPGGSPAALAGKAMNDGEGLAIELPGGEKLTPAGGAAPARQEPRPPVPATPIGSDAAFGELANYGVKRGDYAVSREDGIVVVRVKVNPIADGPARGLTGQGTTETAAVKQIVDQLKSTK